MRGIQSRRDMHDCSLGVLAEGNVGSRLIGQRTSVYKLIEMGMQNEHADSEYMSHISQFHALC